MAYLQQLIAAKRVAPANDLITALIVARDEGDRLSEQELLHTVFVLIGGGFETTVRLLTNSVLTFDAYPDQLARLRAAPELVPPAVDELLRYIPVAISTLERVAREDVELSGVTIPAGSTVIPLQYSANRDSAFVVAPDRFDVTRAPLPHLSFGHGIHHCIGSALARLELETALAALLRRMPYLRPAEPPETLDWITGGTSVGPAALPVTW
jgi:cytochrome P450